MELQGRLESFRVQDILVLLGRTRGQWLLTLSSDQTGFVGMRDGSIVAASADASRQDLARRLITDGLVGTTGLMDALKQSADSQLGVVRALVEGDNIEVSDIEPAIKEHILSAVASLTHWRQGDFMVVSASSIPDDVGVTYNLQDVSKDLGALMRRWRPAMDVVGGETGVLASHPGQVPDSLKGLYSLVDGRRTVAELIDLSGHGEVGTIVDLAALIDSGAAQTVTGPMGALEQRLAMLSAVEGRSASQKTRRPLSVIEGGAGMPATAAETFAGEMAEPEAQEMPEAVGEAATPDTEPKQSEGNDLLAALLRGVRGS